MGKNFEKEISNLAQIYYSAVNSDISIVAEFLSKYRYDFVLLVGSGGSYSVAKSVEQFCVRAGILSKCVTPLELREYNDQLVNYAIILFTAGGKNADSKNAYTYISNMEPKGILTVCMNENAPIKKIQQTNMHNYYFEYKMPIAKDGYLAVESLISAICVMAKAFFQITGDAYFFMDDNFEFKKSLDCCAEDVLCKETVIVLYSGISASAVVDLESKFCEAALSNIQVVDYRNFAHGRHFWLSKRKESTSIIAFVDNDNKIVSQKTLSLLPDEIPVLKIVINNKGVNGLLESYAYVFEIVNQAGKRISLDPGKPKIDEFGKKLYHISSKLDDAIVIKKLKNDPVLRGVKRKVGLKSKLSEKYYETGLKTYKELISHSFKGIVFDYDGTLHNKYNNSETENNIFKMINYLLENNIVIGVATGRGKSVRNDLQKVIYKKFWDKMVIAYYNGGCIGYLGDNSIPNKKAKEFPVEFHEIIKIINDSDIVLDGAEEQNPYQLTALINGSLDTKSIYERLKYISNVKLLRSEHSIDIVPKSSSKNNIFDFFSSMGKLADDFLRVGDSGAAGGNDFELLNTKLGLSVDLVSDFTDKCWNYAPLGYRNLEATLDLLQRISLLGNKDGFFWGE